MATIYVAAGINHFWHPEFYLKMVPRFLPSHDILNYVCGALEILFGSFLFFKSTRNTGAWGAVVLLILIFPSNVQMAYDYHTEVHPARWATYLRLPLQPLLIWWALVYTNWYQASRIKEYSV